MWVDVASDAAWVETIRALKPFAVDSRADYVVERKDASDAEMLTVLWVDGGGRPDVADLARVRELEGVGAVTYRWLFRVRRGYAVLDVQVQRPVRCRFALAWLLDRDRVFLAALARTGQLVVVTADPTNAEGELQPRGFRLTLETGELAAALAARAAMHS